VLRTVGRPTCVRLFLGRGVHPVDFPPAGSQHPSWASFRLTGPVSSSVQLKDHPHSGLNGIVLQPTLRPCEGLMEAMSQFIGSAGHFGTR
jgi:hypothetical protein